MQNKFTNRETPRLEQHRQLRIPLPLLFAVALLPGIAVADSLVTTRDEASLVAGLQGGGIVKVACDGTISLTQTLTIDKDTVLDASGHAVTISGQQSNRVFQVRAGVKFTLVSVTVANGKSEKGGGLFNEGGEVSALDCSFVHNTASGAPGARPGGPGSDGLGGAVYTVGLLRASNCMFAANLAQGGTGSPSALSGPSAGGQGGAAYGGAIHAESGRLELLGCTLAENEARGGNGGEGLVDILPPPAPPMGDPGGKGGAAAGGAVSLTSGNLEMGRCRVLRNRAIGGLAGRSTAGNASGGVARGGGGWSAGEARITHCTFDGNQALGGAGGDGADGFIDFFTAPNGRQGGTGGDGEGGAWFNAGTLLLEGSTLSENQVPGGRGGSGGAGGGGVSNKFNYFRSEAGDGGVGGAGSGGGLCNQGNGAIINTTVAGNIVARGDGGTGGAGGLFTVVYPWGDIQTSLLEDGKPGLAGEAVGGAVLNQQGEVTLVNTILAASSGAGNASGILTDRGHNLSSDASCVFSAATSLSSTDPKLLPLGDYGGPTPTLALAADSPARDHGDDALGPATDQRGVPRPIGSASDMGAYEFVPPPSITPLPEGAMRIEFTLQPSRAAVLEATTDFTTWTDRQTKQTDAAGVFTAIDTEAPRHHQQFYRTKTP